MIKIHESYFFLIILLTALFTYIFFTIFKNCDIKCKVNYYKYENYYTKKSNPPKNNFNVNDLNDFYQSTMLDDRSYKNESNLSNDDYLTNLLNIPVN